MPKKKTLKHESMMMGCCGSWIGIIHLVAGVGVGLLIAGYFTLDNLVMWGWILVALGVLGHILGFTKCKNCGM